MLQLDAENIDITSSLYKAGRITQVGTHEQLMNVAGEYQEMYQSQMGWYE